MKRLYVLTFCFLACGVAASAVAMAQPPGEKKEPPAREPSRKRPKPTAGEKGKSQNQGKRAGAGDRPVKKSIDRPSERAGAPRESRNLAVEAMNLIIADASFDALPFEDFVEWAQRTTGAEVQVRWRVLLKEGIKRETPLTVQARNVPFRKLLTTVFDQLTEGSPLVELAARADGNILIISTRADINAKMFARVYDVEDLLQVAPTFKGPGIDPSVGGGRAMRLRGTCEEKKACKGGVDPVVAELIESITKHIEPRSWKVNGGKGTLRFFRGRLIVFNSIEVHQRLAGTLANGDPGSAGI